MTPKLTDITGAHLVEISQVESIAKAMGWELGTFGSEDVVVCLTRKHPGFEDFKARFYTLREAKAYLYGIKDSLMLKSREKKWGEENTKGDHVASESPSTPYTIENLRKGINFALFHFRAIHAFVLPRAEMEILYKECVEIIRLYPNAAYDIPNCAMSLFGILIKESEGRRFVEFGRKGDDTKNPLTLSVAPLIEGTYTWEF